LQVQTFAENLVVEALVDNFSNFSTLKSLTL